MSIPGCYSFHASESTAFSSKPYQFPENAMVLKFLNLGLEVMRRPQSVLIPPPPPLLKQTLLIRHCITNKKQYMIIFIIAFKN
jgi:hypothetical protein